LTALRAARARLAIALDVPSLDQAFALAERVIPYAGVLKVGLELFVAHGPAAVRRFGELDVELFLDLKLHDIPETVARSVAQARELGVTYLTVHTTGGRAMLEAAAAAARGAKGARELQLLGVTVLTSISERELGELGVGRDMNAHVLALGVLARDAGLRGLVASAQEVARLRTELPEMKLVTPGIRPRGADVGDQARVATPSAAISAGASLLVVGRPVRDAPDPGAAAEAIQLEMASEIESSGR